MIKYPTLIDGATIGVTAPSSGVESEYHNLLKLASKHVELMGFGVVVGETVWTQHKAKSASAAVRAAELNKMMTDDEIDIVIPPWGGELLIEILDQLDFDRFPSCQRLDGRRRRTIL